LKEALLSEKESPLLVFVSRGVRLPDRRRSEPSAELVAYAPFVCAHTNQLPVEFGEGFGRAGSRNVWKGEEIILAFILSPLKVAERLERRLIVFSALSLSLLRGKINCRKSKGSAIFHYDCSAAESCSHFSLVNE
jgi:hypothetical protein